MRSTKTINMGTLKFAWLSILMVFRGCSSAEAFIEFRIRLLASRYGGCGVRRPDRHHQRLITSSIGSNSNGNAEEFSKRLNIIGDGFRGAQVLFAAARLNLFSALKKHPSITSLDLARQLGSDFRATQILCDALVSLQLLEKEKDSYRNTPGGDVLLVDDEPSSQLAMVLHNAELYDIWGQLPQVVQTGRPSQRPPPDAESRQQFAEAMAVIGRLGASETVRALVLSSARTLLDIGGGPGIYAVAFCQENPDLQVTILDDQDTLQVATDTIREAKLKDRVYLHAGNAFDDTKLEPGSFDVVFLSNVIHQYSPEENLRLLKRVAEWTSQERGQIVIKDFVLNPDRTSPTWSSLFAINMLVHTPGGNTYTDEEIESWFTETGFAMNTPPIPLSHASQLIVATRK